MSETQTQALLRFIRVLTFAAIGAGVANVTILKEVVTDPVFGTLTVSLVVAILEALGKLVGGPTTVAPSGIRTLTGVGGDRRPNILSV